VDAPGVSVIGDLAAADTYNDTWIAGQRTPTRVEVRADPPHGTDRWAGRLTPNSVRVESLFVVFQRPLMDFGDLLHGKGLWDDVLPWRYQRVLNGLTSLMHGKAS